MLSPLRTTVTGTQVLTIVLHPAELGSVRATLAVNAGQLTVRLVPTTESGASALRTSLPELRSGLAQGGQGATVLLGDGGSSSFSAPYRDAQGAPPPGVSTSTTAPASADDPPVPSVPGSAAIAAHRLLDVRL